MSTQIEQFCELLDKQGVKYYQTGDSIFNGEKHDQLEWTVTPYLDGGMLVTLYDMNPEQAINATVGVEPKMYICKRCGVAYELSIIDKGFGKPRFCPNCGYKELYQ